MTEDEAKETTCPIRLLAFSIMGTNDKNAAAMVRELNEDGPISFLGCWGSDCAWWVWTGMRRGDDKKEHRLGGCGLVTQKIGVI